MINSLVMQGSAQYRAACWPCSPTELYGCPTIMGMVIQTEQEAEIRNSKRRGLLNNFTFFWVSIFVVFASYVSNY